MTAAKKTTPPQDPKPQTAATTPAQTETAAGETKTEEKKPDAKPEQKPPTQQASSTALTAPDKNKHNILALIQGEKFQGQLTAALMNRMPPDYVLRAAMAYLNADAKLMLCTPVSVAASILRIAQAGLAPEPDKGHAYLIPRKQRDGSFLCTFLFGYKGLLNLAYKSPEVALSLANPVYLGDYFDLEIGSGKPPVHKPWIRPTHEYPTRGDVIGFYAATKLTNGEWLVEWMTKEEVDMIRDRSESYKSGFSPWKTDYVEMGRKTPYRRHFKWIPDENLQRAASNEEAQELGHVKAEVIDGEIVMHVEQEELTESGRASGAYSNTAADLRKRLEGQKAGAVDTQPATNGNGKKQETVKDEPRPSQVDTKKDDDWDVAVLDNGDGTVRVIGKVKKVFDPKPVGSKGGTKQDVLFVDEKTRVGSWHSANEKVAIVASSQGQFVDFICTRKGEYLNLEYPRKIGNKSYDKDWTGVIDINQDVKDDQAQQATQGATQNGTTENGTAANKEQPAAKDLFGNAPEPDWGPEDS